MATWLGYFGAEGWQLTSQHSFVGGNPIWLSGEPSKSEWSLCERCRNPLSFAGQVYAPVEDGHHRVLYFFGCNKGCSTHATTWRVFRSVRHWEDNGLTAANNDVANPVGAAVGFSLGDDWGANAGVGPSADDDWGANGAVGPSISDPWGVSDVKDDWGAGGNSASTNDGRVATSDTNPIPDSDDKITSAVTHGTDVHYETTDCYDTTAPLETPSWPSYFVIFADEPGLKKSKKEVELESRYRDETTRDATNGSSESTWLWTQEDEGEDEANLKAFLKFQKRIERSPEQIMRYARRGTQAATPLWIASPPLPLGKNGAISPPCSHCGGPRVFEMQLLPTLIYEMKERATAKLSAYSDEELNRTMDFGNVLIFSCAQNCMAAHTEEFVIVEEPQ